MTLDDMHKICVENKIITEGEDLMAPIKSFEA